MPSSMNLRQRLSHRQVDVYKRQDSESTYNGYGGTDFMKFRPCIDIHNGKVKQIVGGSLTDVQDQASENFVSEQDLSLIHI